MLATPGLADGFAAGDVIELDAEGNATVIERGPRRVIALTFPVGAGFPAVEAVLNAYVAEHGVEWYFTNVYGRRRRDAAGPVGVETTMELPVPTEFSTPVLTSDESAEEISKLEDWVRQEDPGP